MRKQFDQKVIMWSKKSVKQRMDRKNYAAAPSAAPGVLKLYEEYFIKALNHKKKAKIMVLGATPELRDITLKHGHELVTVDWNIEIVEAWGSTMSFKNYPNETIVKCNWLNIPLKSNYFDLILGDGISNNVFSQDQDKLFKEIKRLLKLRGYVLFREGVLSPKRKIKTLGEIDSDFLKKDIDWFDLFFDSWLYSDIVSRFYNKKTGVSNIDKFLTILEKEHNKKRISGKSLESLMWYKGSGVRVVWPRPKLEKLFKKYFKLIPVKQAQDYKFTQDTMMFFFGKNKK